MFEKITLSILCVSLIGCSARHTEGPQQPSETAATQPAPVVAETVPVVEKPTPVVEPAEQPPTVVGSTVVGSTVVTTDALYGRWDLKTITVGSQTSEALIENSLVVHFCKDGRAKFEGASSKEYYDGFQLDTAAQPWEIMLLKENAPSKRLLMRFVDNQQDVVDYAPIKSCPPDKKCLTNDWKTIQITSINVNQIRRSNAPAVCD